MKIGKNWMPKVGYKFTDEQLEHLSAGHIGQIAWNKGKKLTKCVHALSEYVVLPSGAPCCLACKREQGARYRAKNRVEIRTKGRLSRYGLTPLKFQELWKAQSGCCAICSKPLDVNKYRIDHNHNTGEVRGLLCASCNTAIGLLRDSEAFLLRAVRYLNGHRS